MLSTIILKGNKKLHNTKEGAIECQRNCHGLVPNDRVVRVVKKEVPPIPVHFVKLSEVSKVTMDNHGLNLNISVSSPPKKTHLEAWNK